MLRIYPTYWVGFSLTVGSIAAGAAFFGGSLTYNAKEAILHYLPPLRALFWSKALDGIVWTLEIELFFYLLCAALAGRDRAGRRAVGLAPLALFALWLPIYAFSAHPPAGLEKLGHRFEFLAVYLPFLIFMFTGVALNFRQRGLVSRARRAVDRGLRRDVPCGLGDEIPARPMGASLRRRDRAGELYGGARAVSGRNGGAGLFRRIRRCAFSRTFPIRSMSSTAWRALLRCRS